MKLAVSVVIPYYHGKRFLPGLLKMMCSNSENLRNETGCELEVLIINDGSTDHTGENVAEFIEGKENCHLLQQDNAGLSAARKER